jgi:hypothetical protein
MSDKDAAEWEKAKFDAEALFDQIAHLCGDAQGDTISKQQLVKVAPCPVIPVTRMWRGRLSKGTFIYFITLIVMAMGSSSSASGTSVSSRLLLDPPTPHPHSHTPDPMLTLQTNPQPTQGPPNSPMRGPQTNPFIRMQC